MASRYSKGVRAPFNSNKSEECPDMKVDGEYIVRGINDIRSRLKEKNKKFVRRQTEGLFQRWRSIKEIQSNGGGSTMLNHTINYELSITGKIATILSGKQAEDVIRRGMQLAVQTK